MARPSLTDIIGGAEGWDLTLNTWRDQITSAPFPIHREDDTTDLNNNFPASQYEHCLVVVEADHGLYLSNDDASPGTWVWTRIAQA